MRHARVALLGEPECLERAVDVAAAVQTPREPHVLMRREVGIHSDVLRYHPDASTRFEITRSIDHRAKERHLPRAWRESALEQPDRARLARAIGSEEAASGADWCGPSRIEQRLGAVAETLACVAERDRR